MDPGPGPSWDGIEFTEEWRHQGFEGANAIAIADFLGDGGEQIAVGGRRPGLVSGDGGELLWRVDWDDTENLLRGGDNDWVVDLVAVAREGGGSNILLTTSEGEAWLLDGRDGTRIWREKLTVTLNAPELQLFGDPDAPLFFTKYGKSGRSVATGEVVWTLPESPEFYPFVRRGRLGAGNLAGIMVMTEGRSGIGRNGATVWYSFPELSSISADGTVRFRVEFNEGTDGIQPATMGTADLEGDGRDAAIVAFYEKPIAAFDADGELLWEYAWTKWDDDLEQGRVTQILSYDLDGDGYEEVLIVGCRRTMCVGTDAESSVLVLDKLGTPHFEVDFLGAVDGALVAKVDDGAPVLFMGIKGRLLSDPRAFQAVRLSPSVEEQNYFRVPLNATLGVLELMGSGGSSMVIGAAEDGVLRAFDLEGGLSWTHHLGDFFTAVAAIPDVDGDDRVAFGDQSGTIALLGADGEPLWHRFLDIDGRSRVQAVAQGRLQAGEASSVVAIAGANKACCNGTLEVFDQEGARTVKVDLIGKPLALATADMDGDGADEIVIVEGLSPVRNQCTVRLFDGDGTALWETPIEGCEYALLTVGVMDATGMPSVGVKTNPALLPFPPARAMVSYDGTLRWKHKETEEGALWISASRRGLAIGGETNDKNGAKVGFAAILDPWTGEFRWRKEIPGGPNPDLPSQMLSGRSSNGLAFNYRNQVWVAASNWDNRIYLYEGASGEVVWSVYTENEENHERHRDGPLAFVPPSEEGPAHLVFAQDSPARRRGKIMAISMDGEIMGTQQIFSPASNVVVRQKQSGIPSAVVQTLLGIHSVEAAPALDLITEE